MNYPITGESYEVILSLIARFMLVELNQRRQYQTGKSYYLITATSVKSLQVLIKYLDVNPLRSSKYIDYQDWRKAALLVIEGSQYTDASKIEELKSNMNDNRSFFNWDHLDCL